MEAANKTKARTCLLIILDGFGVNPDPRANAVALAHTPTLTRLRECYPHGELDASESHVGLPSGFMGNSEVGHLNMGAGRIVYQDFTLISRAIEDGSFFKNPTLTKLMSDIRGEKREATLHLVGLVSDAGVHSHISHLMALVELAKKAHLKKVIIHAIGDGRDSSPTSGVDFIRKLESFLRDAGLGKIATITGRFYAMDRDTRWERTELSYRAIVEGHAEHHFTHPVAWVNKLYSDNVTDEFLPPAVLKGYEGIRDGDGVILFNFRADRARQLTKALTASEFPYFPRHEMPVFCAVVTMTPYDESLNIPVAFEKPKVPNTLGEVISREGWRQLRIAETEKYAHVTYFFNGGEERVFEREHRILIPSPREIRTYDLKPEMSAREVTSTLLKKLEETGYEFVVVNFANTDMVGHTGNLRAAIQAVEVVDECLGKIVEWVESNGAFAVITSDHGNCERMETNDRMPLTSHTLQPVPIIVVDNKRQLTLTNGGRLCDIAPTLLNLWGIPKPKEMTGRSLIQIV